MTTCCKMKQVLNQKEYDKLLPVISRLSEKGEVTVQEAMELLDKSRTTVWRYMS